MFDFTSMYASVIVTYNLSLATLQQKREKDSLEVDLGKNGKVLFSKEKGFFPLMLEGIIEKRKKHKKEYKENPSALLKATSNAYKLLANAAYGYQGFFGARYYCREAAASTAALARKNIFEAIDKIKKEGYEIVYSDTDSIAFLLENKTKKDALELLKKINSELPGIMELELEDFYDRGLFVSKRTTKAGAKKKYALITHDKKVKIRGFETVRRDWCELARELQSNVLDRVLEDGNEKKALEIFKKVAEGLKKRKIDMKKIMIRTQLKKSITGYIAEGPHVIAAKKMEEQGIPVSQGMVIEYFIAETREKKKLVREKVKLPNEKGEYNIEYYLNNQIVPAVENIFEVFGINVKDVVDGSSQKKLF
jgi:DNA polymerase Pol2